MRPIVVVVGGVAQELLGEKAVVWDWDNYREASIPVKLDMLAELIDTLVDDERCRQRHLDPVLDKLEQVASMALGSFLEMNAWEVQHGKGT